MNNKKVVVFSPFTNIWEHAYPESLILEGIRKTGWNIDLLRCDGVFKSHCVAMSAAGLTENSTVKAKLSVCGSCKKRRDLIDKSFIFSTKLAEEFLDPLMEAKIDEFIKNTTPENWHCMEIDGVPIGRFAAYELWLNNKLNSLKLPEQLWSPYLGQLKNTLVAYYVGVAYLGQAQPDAVIVYNDHYSVNNAFVAAANKHKIAAYSLHAGWHMVRRIESMSMFRSGNTMANVFQSEAWHNYRDNPISKEDVELVVEHLEGLWEGSSAFAYSRSLEGKSANELRDRLGIEQKTKVLLAAMSSEDELLGLQLIGIDPKSLSQESLFDSQLEWAKFLVQFAAANKDFHLILRLHPRMFPNKRESQQAPAAEEILKLKAGATENVTFNVPEDEIGIYDLAQITDVLLNFRSSVGVEFMAMGIPVVTPSNKSFYTYPDDLHLVGHSFEEYECLIHRAAKMNWSLENSRKAFRWLAFLFSRVAVGFSEIVTSRPHNARPKTPGLRLWVWKKLTFLVLQYGPLIREKRSLRRKSLPSKVESFFTDVLDQALNSISESKLWGKRYVSLKDETDSLKEFFTFLLLSKWSAIPERESLAGRVRNKLEHVG